MRGEILAWCGALDPFAPPEQVDALRSELTAAGVKHQIMVFSEAAHSFTDPDAASAGRPGIAYHEVADRVSWAGTLALLETTLQAAHRQKNHRAGPRDDPDARLDRRD